MIVQEIQNVCDRNCLEPEKFEKNDELCLYFGSTYIKSLVPNREVLFPPSLWNQLDAAVSGLLKQQMLSRDGISGFNLISR